MPAAHIWPGPGPRSNINAGFVHSRCRVQEIMPGLAGVGILVGS